MNNEILKMCKEACIGTPQFNRVKPDPRVSVRYGNTYRLEKAKEEAAKKQVPVDTIINYVNEFYIHLGLPKCENVKKFNPIINDEFYKNIQKEYGLKSQSDIIWMIFTEDGYLGLVALSDDINFDIAESENDYNVTDKKSPNFHTTKGIIVHSTNKKWDKSFVLVFPIKNLPNGISNHDLERGIGNYLISKGAPILDYYSHNY